MNIVKPREKPKWKRSHHHCAREWQICAVGTGTFVGSMFSHFAVRTIYTFVRASYIGGGVSHTKGPVEAQTACPSNYFLSAPFHECLQWTFFWATSSWSSAANSPEQRGSAFTPNDTQSCSSPTKSIPHRPFRETYFSNIVFKRAGELFLVVWVPEQSRAVALSNTLQETAPSHPWVTSYHRKKFVFHRCAHKPSKPHLKLC